MERSKCRNCDEPVTIFYVYRPTSPKWANHNPFCLCTQHGKMYEPDPRWGALNIAFTL